MAEDKKNEILPLSDVRSAVIPATDIAKSIKDLILEGKIDAAKAGVVIKKMEKVAEILKEDEAVKAVITDETMKYLPTGKKSTTLFGATVTYQAVHTFYDFTECGHPVWDALNEIEEEVKKRKKLIEEELKLLIDDSNKAITPNPKAGGQLKFGIPTPTKKSIIVDAVPVMMWQNSGEVAEVNAPKKGQRMGIKYSKM